jgi:SAM-dependent methyltransferase
MYLNVAELREFYTSPLGKMVQHHLRTAVRELWPQVTGERVMVLGFGTPLLRPFFHEAERVMAFMPAEQGVLPWPTEGPNHVALVDSTALPLQDASVDRIILLHTVECAPRLNEVLNEVWRVLTSGGRLLVIAPNRAGLWAHTDHTPFGQGRAYSSRQLRSLLRQHLFIPEQEQRALLAPPSQSPFWLRLAPTLEKIARRWGKALAGVHIVEGSKQLFAPVGLTKAVARKPLPLSKPAPIGLRRE